jgi:hypothetical protein
VPRWLDAIVLRCLMKRRSQRFLDLGELSEQLVQIKSLIGEGGRAAAPGAR